MRSKNVYARSITYKINLKQIKKTSSFTTRNISLKPFPVIHKEYLTTGKTGQVPALGYNFIYDKMKICYGGDTAYCEEPFVAHAKNADLAILEAGHDDEKKRAETVKIYQDFLAVGK